MRNFSIDLVVSEILQQTWEHSKLKIFQKLVLISFYHFYPESVMKNFMECYELSNFQFSFYMVKEMHFKNYMVDKKLYWFLQPIYLLFILGIIFEFLLFHKFVWFWILSVLTFTTISQKLLNQLESYANQWKAEIQS